MSPTRRRSSSASRPAESSVTSQDEEPTFDEYLERAFTDVAWETPQPRGLRHRELQVRHLHVLDLNAIQRLDVDRLHMAPPRVIAIVAHDNDVAAAIQLPARERRDVYTPVRRSSHSDNDAARSLMLRMDTIATTLPTRSPADAHDADGSVQLETLEGREIQLEEKTWTVQLLGHRLTDGRRWVHVALDGTPRYDVLVRMSPVSRALDVIRALEWWLQEPGHETGDVVEID